MTEKGFNYQTSVAYASGFYLHHDGGISTSTVSPTSYQYFTPTSIDLYGYSRAYRTASDPAPLLGQPGYWEWAKGGTAPIPKLTIEGMRYGEVIATKTVGPQDWTTHSFDDQFFGIDALKFTVIYPSVDRYWLALGSDVPPNTAWCDLWCAGFKADNLVLQTDLVAPVPMPASALLYLSALAGVGIRFGRKKRKDGHSPA
ncbi:hypothetical protein [Aliiroseovarius sp. F47248L]|uniref:hypothetical protein n=1 Tax=Aliiroseovarius sp. F47248L TaxID=2926420 RepID=UPI001FF34279|nr:hypothetical protein [Aliiroseovarius sp. F47248L]MCK0139269.1 hypothetical protein [Aliiroseovarius sp. F47248L]